MGNLRYYFIILLYIFILHQSIRAEENNTNGGKLLPKKVRTTPKRERVLTNISAFKDRFFRTLQTESKLKENRYKRSFYNDTVDDNYVSVVNDTDDKTNLTKTTDDVETITDNLKIISLVNDTADRLLLNEKKSSDDLDAQTRRAIPALEYQPQSRIKGKLLSYLEETFDEIDRKIKPLTNIKIALSNNNEYRIGYIIATIDTMQVNLKKWKENTRINQHKWNDEKILDVFDRIKATNKVTSNLIETLKRHLSEGKETKV